MNPSDDCGNVLKYVSMLNHGLSPDVNSFTLAHPFLFHYVFDEDPDCALELVHGFFPTYEGNLLKMEPLTALSVEDAFIFHPGIRLYFTNGDIVQFSIRNIKDRRDSDYGIEEFEDLLVEGARFGEDMQQNPNKEIPFCASIQISALDPFDEGSAFYGRLGVDLNSACASKGVNFVCNLEFSTGDSSVERMMRNLFEPNPDPSFCPAIAKKVRSFKKSEKRNQIASEMIYDFYSCAQDSFPAFFPHNVGNA